jgi:hypothetical protein
MLDIELYYTQYSNISNFFNPNKMNFTSLLFCHINIQTVLNDAALFANAIEQLDDTILQKKFTAAKYGNYFKNLVGIIEHTHYHLGQIVILHKLIKEAKN